MSLFWSDAINAKACCNRGHAAGEAFQPFTFYRFDDFDKIIWNENNENKSPYWECLAATKLLWIRT